MVCLNSDSLSVDVGDPRIDKLVSPCGQKAEREDGQSHDSFCLVKMVILEGVTFGNLLNCFV